MHAGGPGYCCYHDSILSSCRPGTASYTSGIMTEFYLNPSLRSVGATNGACRPGQAPRIRVLCHDRILSPGQPRATVPRLQRTAHFAAKVFMMGIGYCQEGVSGARNRGLLGPRCHGRPQVRLAGVFPGGAVVLQHRSRMTLQSRRGRRAGGLHC
jgi:hypothetical protein